MNTYEEYTYFLPKMDYLGYYLKVWVHANLNLVLQWNSIPILARYGHLWFQVLSIASHDRNTTGAALLSQCMQYLELRRYKKNKQRGVLMCKQPQQTFTLSKFSRAEYGRVRKLLLLLSHCEETRVRAAMSFDPPGPQAGWVFPKLVLFPLEIQVSKIAIKFKLYSK